MKDVFTQIIKEIPAAHTAFYKHIDDSKACIHLFVTLPSSLAALLGDFVGTDLLWIYNIHYGLTGRRTRGICPECYLVLCECRKRILKRTLLDKNYWGRKGMKFEWELQNNYGHWNWFSYEVERCERERIGYDIWFNRICERERALRYKMVDEWQQKYYERLLRFNKM